MMEVWVEAITASLSVSANHLADNTGALLYKKVRKTTGVLWEASLAKYTTCIKPQFTEFFTKACIAKAQEVIWLNMVPNDK